MSTDERVLRVGIDPRAAQSGSAVVVRSFEDIQKSAAKTRDGVKASDTSLDNLGKTAVRVAGALGLVFGARQITGWVGSALKDFIAFDDAMKQSISIMGDVSEAMEGRMAEAAKEVAESLNFSATQSAEAFYFLASAGLDAEQSIAALPQVAAFARAGMFDLARATDLATDAQSALGLSSKDAQTNLVNMTRVTDVLVKAATLANATVEQFSEALTNKAGAALRVLNKDVEEGVAVLAVLADQGVKGAAAGEALSIAFRDLQTAALRNKEAFEDAGIAVFDSNEKMRNIADVVSDLEDRLNGMSDAQKRAELTTLGFQDRSISVLQALLGTSDGMRGYEAAARQAGDTTIEVADKQMLSLQNRLGVLREQFLNWRKSIVEQVVPALEWAMANADKLTDAIIALSVAVAGAAGLVVAFKLAGQAMAALALAQAVAAFLSLAASVKTATEALILLRMAIEGLKVSIGPAGWLLIGISAITTAVYLWRRSNAEAAASMAEIETAAERVNRKLTEQTSAYGDLSEAQLRAELAGREVILADQRASLAQLEQAWQSGRQASQADLDAMMKLREEMQITTQVVDRLKATIAERAAATAEAVRIDSAATDAAKAAREEEEKRLQSGRETIEQLRQQISDTERLIAAYGEGKAAVQDTVRLLALEAALRDALSDSSATQAAEIEGLVRSYEQLSQQLEKLQQQEVEAARAEDDRRRRKEQASKEEQRRRDQAAKDAARAAEESAKAAAEPFLQAARSIQGAFASAFEDVLASGDASFRRLAQNILRIVASLVAQIAAAMTMQKLGISQLIADLQDEQKRAERIQQLQGIAGGAARFIPGAAVGGAVGYQTGSVGAGVLSGAAAGFAAGGPVGAIVGSVAGLVGGLLGSAKKAREAAEQMAAFRRQWETSLDAFANSLTKQDPFARAESDLRAQFEALARTLAAQFKVTITDPEKFLGRSADEFAKMAQAASGSMRTFYTEMGRLAAAFAENQKKLEEVRKAEMERAETDLQIRLKRAQGLTAEADAMARQVAQEDEIRRAREAGWSDELIELLKLVQAEEELARVRAEASDAARRAAEAEAEAARKIAEEEQALARRTAERAEFEGSLLVREAELAGDAFEALRVRLEVQQASELRRAEELLAAGIITEEQFERLKVILGKEMTQSMDEFAKAAEAAAAAMAEATGKLLEDLDVRMLAAQGMDDEAAALRFRIQQQRELDEAIRAGFSADVIDRLREVQQAEEAAFRARRQAAEESSAGAAAQRARAAGSAARGSEEGGEVLRRVAGITETQAVRIDDLLRSINIHTRETALNTRGLRIEDGATIGDAVVRGGNTVVSLRPTINFYGTVADPETAGELVGDAIVRSLQNSLGRDFQNDQRAAGSAART